MNTRNGLIAASVVALLAIIGVLIQSGNLSQTETRLVGAQTSATAQQLAMTDQWVQAQATLSAANTQAADNQHKALADAARSAATAQAQVLGEAANAASTMQAQALAAASQAAATAQADALKQAANAAATAQAKSAVDAKNAAGTQLAQTAGTLQAAATATLGAVVDAAATTQSEKVADAVNTAAAVNEQMAAQATTTVGAVIAQAATDAAQLQATQGAVEIELAAVKAQLATAQASVNVLPGSPTPAATTAAGTVPEGWKRYIGKGVAIQLPTTYVGSELGSDPQALGKMLRALGPDFEAGAALLESNPQILSFIAVNPGSGPQNPSASIIILSISLPTNVPLNALLEATISQLPAASKVIEKGVVPFGEYEAGRMIIETRIGTIQSTQLQYYIITNNTLYLVGFTGAPDYFDIQLPIFEQMMKTFEILAKPGV